MTPQAPAARHTVLAVVALVLGGVGIGTTEFVTMGLLPDIAATYDVTIPGAGFGITAYALGVVVGAPVLAVLGAAWPRRATLIGLMIAFVVANLAAALAPNFELFVLGRFLCGMPHGAYFGLAALAAVDLYPPGRAGRAVGHVMLGIPVANIAGVPLTTALGQAAGWRWAYVVVAVLGTLCAVMVAITLPRSERPAAGTARQEIAALRSLPLWLSLLTGAVGFGGVFAMYSYIAPTVTEVTGLDPKAIPVYLFAFGAAGLVGAPLAGRMVDRSDIATIAAGFIGLAVLLAVFAWAATWMVPGLLVLFAASVFVNFLVVGLQVRLMRIAGSAKNLGAASNHAALNVGNALGAWLGGLVIAAGYGYRAPSLVGVALATAGLACFALSIAVSRRPAALT